MRKILFHPNAFVRWSARGILMGLVAFLVIAKTLAYIGIDLGQDGQITLFWLVVFSFWLEQMMFGWTLDPS